MCPSTSQDKSALIRHMRTHNGERPYECRDCQYAFTTKANCERHLRNRHGKVDRQAVRASIIYHLSEDSGAQQRAPSDADASHNDSASVLDLSADGPDSSAFDERKPVSHSSKSSQIKFYHRHLITTEYENGGRRVD